MSTFFVRYVTHDRIKDYEALGWEVKQSDTPCHHCNHAVIMRYCGDQDPPPVPATICRLDNKPKQPK